MNEGDLLANRNSYNPPCVTENLKRSGARDREIRVKVDDKALKVHRQEFQDLAALFDLIKTCGKQKDLCKGSWVHADILERGLLKKDISLGNALLSMYSKCGALAKARQVFDELPAKNVVTWNALIAAYSQHGLGYEALCCFGQMQDEGLSPNALTFICILKACSRVGAIEKGEEMHAEIGRRGLLQNDIVLGTALVDMYAKCGALTKAQGVFDDLSARNVVTWNALISGYSQRGLGDEALSCFERMQDEGVCPDSVTFICILKACGSIGATDKGEEIHAEVSRQGLVEKDIVLGTALVDMYAKCGELVKAQKVFDKLPARDVVTWTALITGYAQHGLGKEALFYFERMQDEGLLPNTVTFVCALKACGSIGAAEKGEEIHVEIDRQELLEKDNLLGNALVDMYAKCGMLEKAQRVFDKLPARGVDTWNALIAGYVQHGLSDEALSCFGRMWDEGFSPDAVTFICVLKACSSIGAAEKGEEIHAELGRQGSLEKDVALGTVLVDMYSKFGELAKAQEVFNKLPAPGVDTWTALMTGYAQVGKIKTAFDSFVKMLEVGIEPDRVTFVVLLTACSHAGLVEEGQMYFHTMCSVYRIIPTLEHGTCMVDIFSRAGLFDKAISVIRKVPHSDRLLLWSALMGACRNRVDVQLGRRAFEQALLLDEKCTATYICMRNIYATAGMKGEAEAFEALKLINGAWKVPGCCWWTDKSRNVHLFTMGDESHPQDKCIYAKLKDMDEKLRLEGYSPRLQWVSPATPGNDKEGVLCRHSEKLAIACALINTPEGTPIRVTKNMRVCRSCHFATLLISKMENRKIQIIDAKSVHNFEDGRCTCEAYS